MTLSKDIVFEKGKHWVLKVKDGYEVYEIGATCSTRRVQIGITGEKGFNEAILWCNRLESKLNK